MYCVENDRQNEKPDIGSNVYVYYNIDSTIFFESEYLNNGICVHKNDTIKPAQHEVIDASGYAFIKPVNTDQPVIIGVESAYYTGRFSVEYCLNASFSIKYKIINNP